MLEEKEIRKIAQRIVDEAKRTSNYDQGTLRRSISYTYIRGILTFRQMFYGVYNDNSQLERLARKYVPYGVNYKIILTDFDRSIINESRVKQGRAPQKGLASALIGATTSRIRALINRTKNKDGKAQN